MAEDPTKNGAPADEPEGDELDEPTDENEGGVEGGESEEEWTPPTREEYEAQQAAHRAALEAEKAKLARARKQAERLRTGKTAAPGAPGVEGGQPAAQGGEVDVWRGRAVRAAAKAELLDRGADPEMVDLALGRLKVGEIEFNDEDEPELDDWLDDMLERYPKLFAAKAPAAPAPERPRAGRVDQGAAAGATGRPARPRMSLGQQIIANSQAATRSARRGI